jgi:hypothetical protein
MHSQGRLTNPGTSRTSPAAYPTAMTASSFETLIEQVLSSIKSGDLLSEEAIETIFDFATPAFCKFGRETVAWAVRKLGAFCDWNDFRWAEKRLREGVETHELQIEVQQLRGERGVNYFDIKLEEYSPSRSRARSIAARKRPRYYEEMRKAESLMGFDEEINESLLSTLGVWDGKAVPRNLLDLLPDDIGFPLHTSQPTHLYDHRLHFLVKELGSRLWDDGRAVDKVIKHCGHVLAELFLADNEDASFRLILRQLTILADDYLGSTGWDALGLCWRGELACWNEGDENAKDIAERMWRWTEKTSPSVYSDVVAFFAITHTAADWADWGWDRFCPWTHLGEIEATWLDVEQPLARAMVRRAFREGNWDTSLIISAFLLLDRGYSLESKDLPLQCWIWMAENSDLSMLGPEMYYACWREALGLVSSDTDPRLRHNIIVVLLAGLLFDRVRGCELPSIQCLIDDLKALHGLGPSNDQKIAALEMVKHVYEVVKPDYLVAADRLAITKLIDESTKSQSNLPPRVSTDKGRPNASGPTIDQSLLNQAELHMRKLISEALLARLSAKSKQDLRIGEFLYVLASNIEGEGGGFDGFVTHYSKGLLTHIQESLRGPLRKESSLAGEFLRVFKKEYPEWSDLLAFMDRLDTMTGTPLYGRLLGQRVALRRLKDLREPFERMKACRNKAAHTKHRIDREEATVLHDLLWNKGLVRQIIESFPLAPCR